MKDYAASLVVGRPIEFAKGVFIRVPTVEEVLFESDYSVYVSCFTKMTREIFALEREVDALEEEYPTLWSIMIDPYADKTIGQFFAEDKTLTEVVYDGLAYWTGLDADKFKKLTNGKIYYENPDWLIDEAEFNRFAELIKFITLYKEPDRLPPKINSDRRHEIWVRSYTNYMKHQSKKGSSIMDKILVLSVSMDSYIPVEEITKMSLFHFNQLNRLLSLKTIYKERELLRASPNFKVDSKDMKHWTEEFKI